MKNFVNLLQDDSEGENDRVEKLNDKCLKFIKFNFN